MGGGLSPSEEKSRCCSHISSASEWRYDVLAVRKIDSGVGEDDPQDIIPDNGVRDFMYDRSAGAQREGPMIAALQDSTDNAGATDEHRALNYLAMRYPVIYARRPRFLGETFSLSGVDVRPSLLSGTRKLLDVIFANRNTDFTEKFYVRVDVTEEFPFLVTRMSPYAMSESS
jgi:PatG C-terminal